MLSSDKKDLWDFKNISGSLPPASEAKDVIELSEKNSKFSFSFMKGTYLLSIALVTSTRKAGLAIHFPSQ